MKNAMKAVLLDAAVIFLFTLFLTGCHQQGARNKVLKEMPARGTLSYNHVVYVENDGRCDDTDQVIKVTGGKKSRSIRRKYECVSRPQ